MNGNLTILHVITGEQVADQFNGFDSDDIKSFVREMVSYMDGDTIRCFDEAFQEAHSAEAIERAKENAGA